MKRGQITVFLSLLLPLFLAVLGAVLESAYQQAFRSRVQRALLLCEYSMLSEYQTELWSRYGLFFLDTAYGDRVESREKVQARLLTYLSGNLSWKKGEASGAFTPFRAGVTSLEAGDFSRATDGGGMGFYEQAVAFEQELWGAGALSEWLEHTENLEVLEEQQRNYTASDERERRNLEVLRQRRREQEEKETPDPAEGLRGERESSLLAMVIKDPGQLPLRSVPLEQIPSERTLLQGSGPAGRYPGSPVNDQWFHTYLLERFTDAQELLQGEEETKGWLGCELEYILTGKGNDRENLESVARRLLLLREGANYAYLLTDQGKQAEAYALAALVAGITLMPELIDALQQVILLAWAYGESVLDVRGLLQGDKIVLFKTGETWRLPLSRLFTLKSHLEDYDGKSDPGGLSYEGYLRILLTMLGRRTKCMRALDVIEGNVRNTHTGHGLYIDQCIDGMTVQAQFQGGSLFSGLTMGEGDGYILTAERRFCYEW